MKKTVFLILAFIIIGVGVYYFKPPVPPVSEPKESIYVNAQDMGAYSKMQKLTAVLENNEKKVILSGKENFKSGLFNIYAASDIHHLPKVLDNRAINMLLLPNVPDNTSEILRPYDVIVVENMSSFSHLKAINMRTAFIPPAIDIRYKQLKNPVKNYPMFYGNNDSGFSLSLYLAGPTDLKVDVYGTGFSGYWSDADIIAPTPSTDDFQRYPLVLVDQSEEDIKDETVNARIIEVIEQGGLPYLRYNSGVAKMFGEAVPMYMTQEEFLPEIKRLLNSSKELKERREAIRRIADGWNSNSQAQKIIELFDVMKKKMRKVEDIQHP